AVLVRERARRAIRDQPERGVVGSIKILGREEIPTLALVVDANARTREPAVLVVLLVQRQVRDVAIVVRVLEVLRRARLLERQAGNADVVAAIELVAGGHVQAPGVVVVHAEQAVPVAVGGVVDLAGRGLEVLGVVPAAGDDRAQLVRVRAQFDLATEQVLGTRATERGVTAHTARLGDLRRGLRGAGDDVDG